MISSTPWKPLKAVALVMPDEVSAQVAQRQANR